MNDIDPKNLSTIVALVQEASDTEERLDSLRDRVRVTFGAAGLSPPLIHLEKVDSKIRKSLPTLVCAHCPFCGKKTE